MDPKSIPWLSQGLSEGPREVIAQWATPLVGHTDGDHQLLKYFTPAKLC